jgi:hypothetical protein
MTRLSVPNLFVVAVLSLASVGCGGSGGGSGSSETAMLRIISGSWAVGSLSVIVNGATVATNIAYPTCVNEVCEALSSYLTVPAGGVAFAVEDTSSTTNLVPQLANLNLAPNTHNTLIVVGTVDAIPAGGYLLRDDDTPAANSVKLRIASTDPTVGTLAAWVLPDGTTPSGTPTISNVMLGSASSYLTLPPGAYDETFAITCFVGPNCIGVGPTTLSANKNVTVYVLSEGLSHRPLILADN